jgi:hypothetical protein
MKLQITHLELHEFKDVNGNITKVTATIWRAKQKPIHFVFDSSNMAVDEAVSMEVIKSILLNMLGGEVVSERPINEKGEYLT